MLRQSVVVAISLFGDTAINARRNRSPSKVAAISKKFAFNWMMALTTAHPRLSTVTSFVAAQLDGVACAYVYIYIYGYMDGIKNKDIYSAFTYIFYLFFYFCLFYF